MEERAKSLENKDADPWRSNVPYETFKKRKSLVFNSNRRARTEPSGGLDSKSGSASSFLSR